MIRRVCIVCPLDSDSLYSVSLQSLDLALAFIKTGSIVKLIFLNASQSEESKRLIDKLPAYLEDIDYYVLQLNEIGVGPVYAKMAQTFYEWLKNESFDFVISPERRGITYFALSAKKSGQFYSTYFLVWLQEPTLFTSARKEILAVGADEFIADEMERQVIKLSDIVVSTSQYMSNWVLNRDWVLPKKTKILPTSLPVANADLLSVYFKNKTVVGIVNHGPEIKYSLRLFFSALPFISEKLKSEISFQVIFTSCNEISNEIRDLIIHKLGIWSCDLPYICVDDNNISSLPKWDLVISTPYCGNQNIFDRNCIAHGLPLIASFSSGLEEYENVVVLKKLNSISLSKTLHDHFELMPLAKNHCGKTNSKKKYLTAENLLELINKYSLKRNKYIINNRLFNYIRKKKLFRSPLVSVCITHFERPYLLEKALESIENQLYKSIEIIVVDDGSYSSETKESLNKIEKSRQYNKFKMIRTQNGYLGKARNIAAKHADGDYLIFFDDDDLAKPELIGTLVNAVNYSDADIVTCFFEFFSDTDEIRPKMIRLFLGDAPLSGVFDNAFGGATSIIKRNIFESLGGFREEFGIGHEDWEFYARASIAGYDILVYPEPLFYYRQTSESMLRGALKQSQALNFLLSAQPYINSQILKRPLIEYILGMEHVFKVDCHQFKAKIFRDGYKP